MRLYRVDARGNMRVWDIEKREDGLYMEHGLLGGQLVKTREVVPKGKANRTLEEQIEQQCQSRINKQIRRGYFITEKIAESSAGMNSLETFKPMLAQKFDPDKKIEAEGAVYQYKLDGNRLLVTRNKGELFAYTRNGKKVNTLDHILHDLAWLKEGETIDGEVYVHGIELKDIGSRMRRKQELTSTLQYHVYDTIDDRPFTERFQYVASRIMYSRSTVVKPVGYHKIKPSGVPMLFDTAKRCGYEGLIMRLDKVGYEVGKRSKNLLKIKGSSDAEATVIDVEQARDSTGILVLELPSGKTFKLVPPGDKPAKVHVGMMPELYVGKRLTFNYSYMTSYGIPFHAVALRWR